MTEGLSQEITLRYLRSKGSVPALAETELRKFFNPHRAQRYAIYIVQLQFILEKVAAHQGMGERDIWDAIKQGYFAGEWLASKDNRAMIDAACGEGFVREYAKIGKKSTDEQVEAFNSKFGITFNDAAIGRWLEHLNLRTTVAPVEIKTSA